MSHWWQTTPWRMVQTNLPEQAMADMDAERFAQSLADFGATVVNLNAAGIIASYPTDLEFQPRSQYLTGDSLLDMVNACHRHGIRVIARTDFSRIRREVYEQHRGLSWLCQCLPQQRIPERSDVQGSGRIIQHTPL